MLISVIVEEIWSLMASLLTLREPCYWHRFPLHGVANVLSRTDQIFPGIAFFLVFRKHLRYIACLRA